ncbi:MAG: hypothetical protein N3F09_01780 [Bacteroidia bacterium]|nr:hypothetical protein [Bacteroidia bacterium]
MKFCLFPKYKPVGILIILMLFCSFKADRDNCLPLKFPFDDAYSDLLGNVYVLNKKKTEILKYNHQGKFINRYSNLSLGKIHHVDVSNPLRILLFYKQRQALVFLDSQLSPNGDPIWLEKTGVMNASMVCSSSLSNGFWVYNEQDNELYRFNSESTLQIKSGNLRLFLGDQFHPSRMAEFNSRLFLSDSLNGIFVFDQFGSHKHTYAIKTNSEFFANEEQLWYLQGSVLFRYRFKEAQILTDSIGKTGIRKIYFTKNSRIEVFVDSVSICK